VSGLLVSAAGLPAPASQSHAAHIAAGLRWLAPPAAGLVGLLGLWWLGGWIIASSPRLAAFTGFAPAPTLKSFAGLIVSGGAWHAAGPSLSRVMQGLAVAFLAGVPVGIAVGLLPILARAAQLPFQILRMISPLSWMPIAILAFPTWDGAIVSRLVKRICHISLLIRGTFAAPARPHDRPGNPPASRRSCPRHHTAGETQRAPRTIAPTRAHCQSSSPSHTAATPPECAGPPADDRHALPPL
jgi:hypothetical protein